MSFELVLSTHPSRTKVPPQSILRTHGVGSCQWLIKKEGTEQCEQYVWSYTVYFLTILYSIQTWIKIWIKFLNRVHLNWNNIWRLNINALNKINGGQIKKQTKLQCCKKIVMCLKEVCGDLLFLCILFCHIKLLSNRRLSKSLWSKKSDVATEFKRTFPVSVFHQEWS